MKNVLFATTALVAMAGAVAAQEVGFSGSLTAGYNDETNGGLFWEANLELSASVDLGDNVTASVDVTLFEWDGVSSDTDFSPTVEIAYTGDPLTASIKFGDLNDKGASEYFYADRSGMEEDVANHDGNQDVRVLLGFGNFGLAVGCGDVANGDCDDGINVGAGATFGDFKIGLGYDEGAGAQSEAIAVSVDTTFGALDVGVSYIDVTGNQTSLGLEVAYTVSDALSVGAYFADNSVDGSGYGVNLDYTAGPLTAGVFFDYDASESQDEYGVEVAYQVTDMLTGYAGFMSGSFDQISGPGVGDFFYVGAVYAVNDNISATVSYSDMDEEGNPEFMQGVTASITGTF